MKKQKKSRDDHEKVLLNLVHSKTMSENIQPLKYGFCNKSFRKDEPLTS